MARARRLAVTVQDAAGAKATPSPQKLRAWARHALGKTARGELTLRIVDEEESAALNSRYRWPRERQRVIRNSPPRIHLVRVVGRTTVATLATWDAGQAVVPIAAIGDEAIG